MKLFYIGLFGAAGCMSRYWISGWTYSLLGRTLPYGTLMVNMLGSFLLGLVMEAGLRTTLLPADVRLGLTVGFMGGFTTFSTFSYETWRLIEDGSFWQAGVSVLLNVFACLVLVGLGIYVARQL